MRTQIKSMLTGSHTHTVPCSHGPKQRLIEIFFYPIGGGGGANFLDQSQRVVKKTMLKISLLKAAEKKKTVAL